MHKTTVRRALYLPVAALLGLSLVACGGSSKKSGDTGSFSTGSSTPTQSPGAGPTQALSKGEFVVNMNAVCAAVDSQRRALPTPSGLTDYPAIAANLSGTLRILPSFIAKAEGLVNQSVDKAQLTTKWLALEKSDYAATKPIAERMVADSTAKNASRVQADGAALSAAPDHSATIAQFMTGYGLTACATLETS